MGTFAGDEFMKDMWRGKIPIEFTLHDNDCASLEAERPCPTYKLIPRISYLPFYIKEIKQHFSTGVAAGVSDVWFSRDTDQGTPEPIPWHQPVGVIFDWLMLKENKETPQMLPLKLRVHFTNFPDIMRIDTSSHTTTMDVFNQALKQAHVLMHSNTRLIQELPPGMHADLQDAVKECNYSKYAEMRKHMHRSDERLKRMPIFIHLDDDVWLRAPNYPAAGEEGPRLGHFLRDNLSNFYPLSDEECIKPREPPTDRARMLVQGIVPMLNTPLHWLVEYMSHPNGFLYIVVRTRS